MNDGGIPILLIEDEAAIARLTSLLLHSEGYAVDVVASHRAALPLLAGKSFKLILADTDEGANTASLSGFGPLFAAADGRPVLLFTAHRFSACEIATMGFAGLIKKPFDVDELLATVARTLTVQAAPVTGGAAPASG